MTYIHQLDPFALQLFGDFGIRWYGLGYIAGFFAGYAVMVWLAKKKLSLLQPGQVADFITYIALGTMIGGRLGYVLFYNPELLIDFRSSLPFWGVLAVNEGGMASHGGMIGITLACFLYGRKIGVTPFHLYDLVVFTSPFGVIFVRIANFINAELIGRDAPDSHWFKVKYPTEILNWTLSKKAALQDVVAQVGVSESKWSSWISRAKSDAGANRSIDETLQNVVNAVKQGQQNVIEVLGPHLTAKFPSQLYAAFTEGIMVFVFLWLLWARPQKPGVIAAAFLLVYGVGRIINEQFRMPDAHLGFQLFGMTRGQWLSVGMLVIGVVLVYLWQRRPVEKIGGWLSRN